MSGVFRPLRADEIEVRVGQENKAKTGYSLLLYKTARTDMALLDEVYTAMGWQAEYSTVQMGNDTSLVCTISVWDKEKQQWIKKSNCGSETNVEAEKGNFSDAMKRAGFLWGIGRELYNAPFIWINEPCDKFRKYDVTDIAYEGENITKLVIVDSKTRQVLYTFPRQYSNAPKTEPPKPVEQPKTEQPKPDYDNMASQFFNPPQDAVPPELFKEDETVREMFDSDYMVEEKNKMMCNAIRQASSENAEFKEWVGHRLMITGKTGKKLEEIGAVGVVYIYEEGRKRGLIK